MTRPGKKELSHQEHQQIARLMYLHMETHPARIARLHGITAKYVRQLWAAYVLWDSALPGPALAEQALSELRIRAKIK